MQYFSVVLLLVAIAAAVDSVFVVEFLSFVQWEEMWCKDNGSYSILFWKRKTKLPYGCEKKAKEQITFESEIYVIKTKHLRFEYDFMRLPKFAPISLEMKHCGSNENTEN